MKTRLILLFCFFGSFVFAQEAEVKQTVQQFFEGFHQKDSLKMKQVCSPTLRLESITESKTKGNQFTVETPAEFYKAIVSLPAELRFEERLLRYSIQVDGTMAVAWTPYEFYINGKLSHSGVNVFTLFKNNGIWTIISIIDTRRRP
ncbi:nuclear transport factor 2 family protein [Flavobacterium sp. N1719]|uniref:nuclear transport factor 2 family protein n=1 Tax=Flavobacterium sp. N1719 TaxID=2885633 RepID=UPI002222260E|nr:nuclear transport factor 2 family protein [Flavobacterium sp. N1719]